MVENEFASAWWRSPMRIAASLTLALSSSALLPKLEQRTPSPRSTTRGLFVLRRSLMGAEHLWSGG